MELQRSHHVSVGTTPTTAQATRSYAVFGSTSGMTRSKRLVDLVSFIIKSNMCCITSSEAHFMDYWFKMLF